MGAMWYVRCVYIEQGCWGAPLPQPVHPLSVPPSPSPHPEGRLVGAGSVGDTGAKRRPLLRRLLVPREK